MFNRVVLSCLLFSCQLAHGGTFVERPKAVIVESDVQASEAGSPLDGALVSRFCGNGANLSGCVVAPEIAQDFAFVKLTHGSLTFKRLYYKADEPDLIRRQMAYFRDTPLDDDLGKQYIAFASSRGNTVSMYRPPMTERLMRLFDPQFSFRPAYNIINYTNVENALIERAPDGAMVSLMMRGHQSIYNFTARSYQYTTFVFGHEYMRLLENRMSNSFIADTYIRDVNFEGSVSP